MYDVKCDVNTVCILIALVDDRCIRVSATENHTIFNTRSSANNLIEDAVVPELVYMQNNSAFLTNEPIY